ncbi:PQQ-dependent sugar dehydrogenase [Fibrella aquatilis]|uniref:PQQ-dependent sugar dehydrogenase n=1 Tax=Fibrella aquatilis TaxID=2817059 RepID=A0A939G7D5_9BACT|nr:PQQ-dependent sugar dehydrogenase [Fibrella aquatilis]MBO0932578.1 PQQ-dependent sugar dehydrogenase [Fibrella aquatilis]
MKNTLLLLTCCLGVWACTRTADPISDPTPPTNPTPAVQTKTLLTGYEIIWGMDFLPNGDLIFGEKRGRIYRRSGEVVTELTGLPTDINSSGQGGLLDIRVHPNYAANGWIYASYAASAAGTTNTQLNLVRFKITENRLTELQTLFRAAPTNQWKGHYGSRIEFDKSGFLYLSIGEGGPSSYGGATSPNKNAQNVQTEWGKVHRMTDAGAVPTDNPILPGNTAPTTVFSYGHRNPQGLIVNPTTGDMWESEHSAKGGDELNILKKGANYGWPLVSYGINYDGTTISASPTMAGVENPIYTWTPSVGPCGLAFITSDAFKTWKGNLLVGGLALNYLSRLELDGNKVVRENKLLEGNRIRNVKQAPDGSIYVSVENPGRVLQLTLQ